VLPAIATLPMPYHLPVTFCEKDEDTVAKKQIKKINLVNFIPPVFG